MNHFHGVAVGVFPDVASALNFAEAQRISTGRSHKMVKGNSRCSFVVVDEAAYEEQRARMDSLGCAPSSHLRSAEKKKSVQTPSSRVGPNHGGGVTKRNKVCRARSVYNLERNF